MSKTMEEYIFMESKYKIGDRVRVKSLEWYNANKDTENGNMIIFGKFHIFDEYMSEFCGKVVTIEYCDTLHNLYQIKEDGEENDWSDDMFECLVDMEIITI
jgi:hypothetical protein